MSQNHPQNHLKIVSWNVNSIKQRAGHVIQWINDHQPDFICLQELKGLDFPPEISEQTGYDVYAAPQKGRNGVAILTNKPAQDITLCHDKLPGFEEDEQARYIELSYKNHRVINIYAPNGNPVDSEKYPYKLKWMEHLHDHLMQHLADEKDFVICGDFNIIPADQDCYNPTAWADDALFRLETRQIWRRLINAGLTDAFRVFNNQAEEYTFWDYQAGAWPRNHGIRIDHFLLPPQLADNIISCHIDKTPRGLEKPSDHTAIVLKINTNPKG